MAGNRGIIFCDIVFIGPERIINCKTVIFTQCSLYKISGLANEKGFTPSGRIPFVALHHRLYFAM